MQIEALKVPEVKLIKPSRHYDRRGFLSETYNRQRFAEFGIDTRFCAGQSLVFFSSWGRARIALPTCPLRAGETRPRHWGSHF